MHTVTVEVTPAKAAEWLEKNTFNRSISAATVNKYASDMMSGAWTLNHQGIAFGDDDVLVDGQHRLMAIVKSGMTIKMLVTFGAARTGIDELRVRSQFDVAKFGGMTDWMTRKRMETGKVAYALFIVGRGRSAMSTTQIVDFCDKNKDAIMWVDENFTRNVRCISAAAVRAVFMAAYYHFDHEKLSAMVRALYSGVVSGKHESAAVRARDMLQSGELGGGAIERLNAAKKLSRAVAAYCNGESLSKLMPQQEFSFSLPEGKQ